MTSVLLIRDPGWHENAGPFLSEMQSKALTLLRLATAVGCYLLASSMRCDGMRIAALLVLDKIYLSSIYD
jgi:hypothetical protein